MDFPDGEEDERHEASAVLFFVCLFFSGSFFLAEKNRALFALPALINSCYSPNLSGAWMLQRAMAAFFLFPF